MKLTKSRLKRIIREELNVALREADWPSDFEPLTGNTGARNTRLDLDSPRSVEIAESVVPPTKLACAERGNILVVRRFTLRMQYINL